MNMSKKVNVGAYPRISTEAVKEFLLKKAGRTESAEFVMEAGKPRHDGCTIRDTMRGGEAFPNRPDNPRRLRRCRYAAAPFGYVGIARNCRLKAFL